MIYVMNCVIQYSATETGLVSEENINPATHTYYLGLLETTLTLKVLSLVVTFGQLQGRMVMQYF